MLCLLNYYTVGLLVGIFKVFNILNATSCTVGRHVSDQDLCKLLFGIIAFIPFGFFTYLHSITSQFFKISCCPSYYARLSPLCTNYSACALD